LMEKQYRFGISTTVDLSVDIFTQLDIFARAGFDFISLSARPAHSRFFDREAFAEVLRRVEELGFFIESAHFPFWEGYDPAAMEEKDRELALKNLAEYMEFAGTHKIPIVIVHPHYYWICENLLEEFGNDRVGFCYDSSHENMSGKPFHLLSKFYHRLTTTHLSDNHGGSDEHLVPGILTGKRCGTI